MGESADPDRAELTAKLARARESYQEVLDATKHQDDKINRVLVGIAFLTTGAIAFLFRTDVVAKMWTFGSHRVPFVALTAGCYFALTMAAVVLLLLSLSSELRLPSGRRQEPLRDSYLYFTMIAGRTEASWLRGWRRSADEIDEQLLDQYQRETYNIALRARLKYGRTDEAAALFVLALMFLAAGFLLALTTVYRPAAATVGFTWATALVLGGVFAAHATLQLSTLHRFEQQLVELTWRIRRQADARARLARRRRDGMRWLLAAVPVYVLAVAMLTVVRTYPWREVLILIAAGAAFAAYRGTAPRWARDDAHRSWLSPMARGARPYTVASVAAYCLAMASYVAADPWPALAAAAAVPVVLSAITVGRQLTVASRVAARADPDDPVHREEIDDQLLPATAPPPGNVGGISQNEPGLGGDGEAAAVAAAARAAAVAAAAAAGVQREVRSAGDIVTGMLGHPPAPGSVVYVSQPITTGLVYVALRRSGLAEQDIKAAAKQANRASTRALVARVRSAFAGQDVLDPSDYEEAGLAQHDYHSLWQEVLEEYGRVVVFADGWQFSVGCCIELQAAVTCGLEVFDAALAPLPPATAAELVAAAMPELVAAGIDVAPVERALVAARAAS